MEKAKSEESQMRIRPRFRQVVDQSMQAIKDKVRRSLDADQDICTGEIVQNHVILKIPKSKQHYWSPQLTLQLEDQDGKTLIRGLYGPKPSVWTMFVFFYSAIGFFTVMGLLFGISQWMLKMNAWALWSVPVGVLLMFGFFMISKIGQGLGKDQMEELKSFVDSSLEFKND